MVLHLLYRPASEPLRRAIFNSSVFDLLIQTLDTVTRMLGLHGVSPLPQRLFLRLHQPFKIAS